jgi:hypothetical protein
MLPSGCRQWMTRVSAPRPTRKRSWPMGTRPSGRLGGPCAYSRCRATRGRADWSAARCVFRAGRRVQRHWGALEFAMDFVGVAVAAQIRRSALAAAGVLIFSAAKRAGQAALPVLVLAFDLAFGLCGEGIAQRNSVKVQSLP